VPIFPGKLNEMGISERGLLTSRSAENECKEAWLEMVTLWCLIFETTVFLPLRRHLLVFYRVQLGSFIIQRN
jgi:hypothetical protein